MAQSIDESLMNAGSSRQSCGNALCDADVDELGRADALTDDEGDGAMKQLSGRAQDLGQAWLAKSDPSVSMSHRSSPSSSAWATWAQFWLFPETHVVESAQLLGKLLIALGLADAGGDAEGDIDSEQNASDWHVRLHA